ncbi:EF-hand domain-containing family member A2 [Elysia marginata]|uniref:EF-hand domain-containing family member A2 n=1 Tax=Elysia marginata TaxID=1093978 RepID=A0AAV4EVV4_9GAST|nr:EF-hand domain-containing family member A2 [Elysia marginata]
MVPIDKVGGGGIVIVIVIVVVVVVQLQWLVSAGQNFQRCHQNRVSDKDLSSLAVEEPHSGFRIAFNMFDTDGNQIVDKREFLVLCGVRRSNSRLLTVFTLAMIVTELIVVIAVVVIVVVVVVVVVLVVVVVGG